MEGVKIAVIADVHANRYALQAFLAWLSRHPEIEQAWNPGDFRQQGPHPAEVTDLLLQDGRFLTILGNNEHALLHRDVATFPANEIAHQDWTIVQLGIFDTFTSYHYFVYGRKPLNEQENQCDE